MVYEIYFNKIVSYKAEKVQREKNQGTEKEKLTKE